jgi:hypothetical protein
VWADGVVPLAQEDEAEGGEGVDGDPEAGDQLLFEGQRRALLGLLVLGQLLDFDRLSRIDVLDQALGRRALLCDRCQPGLLQSSAPGSIPMGAVECVT